MFIFTSEYGWKCSLLSFNNKINVPTIKTEITKINIVLLGIESDGHLKLIPDYLKAFIDKLPNKVLVSDFAEPASFMYKASEEILSSAGFKVFQITLMPRAGEREKDWVRLSIEIFNYTK